MKTNKLLAAVAVLALVAASAAVIMAPADAAGDITVTDVQYQEGKRVRLLVTFSDEYTSNPAKVTVSGDNLETPIETMGDVNKATKTYFTLRGNTLENGTYTIKVDDLPAYDFVVSDEPVITSITATAAKTSYFVGESFDASGLVVTANYAAGEPAVLPASDYTYAPAGALALTDTKITVTLVADEKITTEVPITVKEKQVLVNVTFQISEGFTKTVPAIVGQVVEPIAEPKVEGAEFIGWFLADATEPFDFDTPITGETTLYAHYGPVTPEKAATEAFILINQCGDGIGFVIHGVDGYVPSGTLTVTVKFATLIPGTDFYWNGSMDLEPITITSDGSDTVFGTATLTDFQYYSDIFAVEASFDADSLDEPVKSSKIYFEPVLEA